MKLFAAITILFVVSICLFLVWSSNQPGVNTGLKTIKIFNLVNEYRVSKNLSKLTINTTLCDYASQRLSEIHTDSSHNGYWKNPPYYSKLPTVYTGENLAERYSSEKDLVNAWIASTEHLANIENPKYTQTCIKADSYIYGHYVVQEFSSDIPAVTPTSIPVQQTQSADVVDKPLFCVLIPPISGPHGAMSCGYVGQPTPYYCLYMPSYVKGGFETWTCGYLNQPNSVKLCLFAPPVAYPAPILCK